MELQGPGHKYIRIAQSSNDTTWYTFLHPCHQELGKANKSVKTKNFEYEYLRGITDTTNGYSSFGLEINPKFYDINSFIPIDSFEERVFKIAMDSIASEECKDYDLTNIIGFIRLKEE